MAEHVDVLMAKRRQTGNILVADREAFDAQLGQGGIHIDGIPQNDEVDHEAEGAKLVLLAIAVALAQLPATPMENDAGELVALPSVPMMGSWPVLVNQYSGPIFWGMELLSCLLPDSTSLHPVSWHLDPDQATAALSLISQQPAPECPLCHVAARRLHSRYERTLADLPWAGWTVRLELGVRKLFCDNPDCGRRIFTERLPGVVAPWARRTLRLGKRLTTVALGGSAGARLSRDLGIAQHAAAVDPCGAPAGLPNPDGPGRR